MWINLSNIVSQDEFFMAKALAQAKKAQNIGEVPIGAVLVINGEIIAEDFNRTITNCDPTAHAEILVIRKAAEVNNNYRLIDAKLYVTLEPCIMCLGALVQARVSEVVYATADSRVGVFSCKKLHEIKDINHNMIVRDGALAEECASLLKDFFRKKRQTKV